MLPDHDDAPVGRVLGRREVLALLGTSAGVALCASRLRGAFSRADGAWPTVSALAATPSCIVRPALTEGPYFVDERLNRSDIRSDPSNGTVKDGAPLALRFAVSRMDGAACTPLAGALVDVWHCDALGVYSDVTDPGFTTVGQKYLRGYQVTDADGAARFTTIYPGWYGGRTVHIHFKIRTDPTSAAGLDFTSQVFFDDSLTDVVHARAPYATKGPRTLRNAGDFIYRGGGDQLLLTVTDDGAGGYVATFEVAIDATGTSGGRACTTVAACQTALATALPDPSAATSRKARRVARRLRSGAARVAKLLGRADGATSARQTRLRDRARTLLATLLALSQDADERGVLDVALAPLAAAIGGLLDQIPS
jgi:protocatechuate 3,4-dioxygenase beta subunit